MAIITIDGVALPAPADLSFGVQDIVKAERNARGAMIKELIATKRKLDLTWSYLSAAHLATVFSAVAPNFFLVTYLDPVTNANRTATFYAGDRSAGVINYRIGVPRYKDVKFSIIEK